MQPSGKNKGGYFGETIDIVHVLAEIDKVAKEWGWAKEVYYQNANFEFPAFKRRALNTEGKTKNIYISSGIHGDEPAGPLATLKMLQENNWPANANLWVCPVLNPEGFVLNTRENEKKIDLNRDYKNPQADEVKAHISWLSNQARFDLSLCLHEDWEAKGFYLYKSKDRSPNAENIIEKVKEVFPIDHSSIIDDFPAHNGVVRPDVDEEERGDWPEALYLIESKGGDHYTFEAASDFEMDARIKALIVATREAISELNDR